jgi:hypothetical protein
MQQKAHVRSATLLYLQGDARVYAETHYYETLADVTAAHEVIWVEQ